jgi:hypothetical protein
MRCGIQSQTSVVCSWRVSVPEEDFTWLTVLQNARDTTAIVSACTCTLQHAVRAHQFYITVSLMTSAETMRDDLKTAWGLRT